MPTLSYELFAYLEFLRQSSDSFILSLQVLKQCKLLDPAPSLGAVTKLLKCLSEITEPSDAVRVAVSSSASLATPPKTLQGFPLLSATSLHLTRWLIGHLAGMRLLIANLF